MKSCSQFFSSHSASCTHEALMHQQLIHVLPNITPHLLSWSVHFGPQTEIIITFLKTYLVSICTLRKVKGSLFVTFIVKTPLITDTDWKIVTLLRSQILSKCPRENFPCKKKKGTKSFYSNTIVELALRPISTNIHWCSIITTILSDLNSDDLSELGWPSYGNFSNIPVSATRS